MKKTVVGGVMLLKLAEKPNRLIEEKSPYLLQHAYNPVDWYPWGEEPFEKAKEEDKPIFLSIGYSSCHWCHTMARESFEDAAVAALLNEYFVSIKVDREERPDVDQIYMSACQALTGQGGWPLSAFLTPDKKPFFVATYIPKHSRYGITGMMELLPLLVSLWKDEREKAVEAGERLAGAVAMQSGGAGGGGLPGAAIFDEAYRQLLSSFDERHGGFGGAPKFPVPHRLTFLLRYWKRTGEPKALEMVDATLKSMARGGIFDQLGLGFHRYSTDERWLAPHFEKMLYDQALLAIAYLEAYQATEEREHADMARSIFEYVLGDLRTPEGAFCSAEDADTEGEEGLFYLWTPAEIVSVLGAGQGELIAEYFGATRDGNFEGGRSILHRPHDHEQFAAKKGLSPEALAKLLGASRKKLLEARGSRERPFKDDKVISSWNGLIIAALARGAAALGEGSYAGAAAAAAAFIREKMTASGGRLMRRYRDGEAALPAYLDDYAFLAWGLLELYQVTFEPAHLEWALSLSKSMCELFKGPGAALQFAGIDRVDDLPPYIDAHDGALPSGNSVAALNLLQLGRLTGDEALWERGQLIIESFAEALADSPSAYTHLLAALDFALGPAGKLVVTGEASLPEVEKMVSLLQRRFYPNTLLLLYPGGSGKKEIEKIAPFTEPASADPGEAAAYLCGDRSCLPPVFSAAALEALLKEQKL